MRYALNKNNQRISILQSTDEETYYCPICHQKVFRKLGKIISPHFSHYHLKNCFDTWHYEEMSFWHSSWQDLFPDDCQEVIKKNESGKIHRADVLLENVKTVIEFQHSALLAKEFNDRNSFYNSLGYKVYWVFDKEDEFKNETISNLHGEKEKYIYNSASFRTLKGFDYKNSNVKVYFQKDENTLEELTWISSKGIHYFCGRDISKQDFIKTIYNQNEICEEKKIEILKCSLPYYWKDSYKYLILENKNDERVMVTRSPLEQLKKYHKIYCRKEDSFGNFEKESSYIKDALDPIWKVIVYRNKSKKSK